MIDLTKQRPGYLDAFFSPLPKLCFSRTYGSNREAFRSQIGLSGSYGSHTVGLSVTNDDDIESPPPTAPSSQRLSPGIDSSPTELAFST